MGFVGHCSVCSQERGFEGEDVDFVEEVACAVCCLTVAAFVDDAAWSIA